MVLIERIETTCLGGPRVLRFLEFNDNVFVNRSVDIKSAIRKIRKKRTEFSTKQAISQMKSVAEAEVSYDMTKLMEVFPEHFI